MVEGDERNCQKTFAETNGFLEIETTIQKKHE